MKKLLLFILFLFGCTHKNGETASLHEISNPKKLKEVAREFLLDIGGEEVILSPQLKGWYFNPDRFRKQELTAYKKWRPLFAHPRNCKLAEMFQINYDANSILSLFSLPRMTFIKNKAVSALLLPSFSLPIEFDPKWILTYLSKGVHLLAINYEKEEKTMPKDAPSLCTQAKIASDWLEHKVPGKLFILGKALGSVPASFVAAHTKNAHLILENALFLEPLTQANWLKQVSGKILIIKPLGSDPPAHLPKNALLMDVLGSHFGPYFGDTKPTWYENEKDQQSLLKFLW